MAVNRKYRIRTNNLTGVFEPDKRYSHLIPTWQDVEVLQSLHDVLSPLVNFTQKKYMLQLKQSINVL